MYTSGSTGDPKGVMISGQTMKFDISHALYIHPLVTVSFIPLSHSTDRMRVWETVMNGGRIGFANYHASNWEEHESGLKKQSLLESESRPTNQSYGVEGLMEDI